MREHRTLGPGVAVHAPRAVTQDGGALAPETDRAHLADALWALAGPQLYTQLTAGRGWPSDTYEEWLAATLTATLR